MVETIRSSLIIPNIIKNSLGEYNLQQRSVDYIVINSNNEKISKISKDDSFKYYEKNKINFLSDELRSAETLLLDANKYAKKLTVTEDEIKLLYEERKESLMNQREDI